MSGPNVEVGFSEKLNNPLLYAPHHFPSKVGGHPSWLNPSNLPTVPLCSHCSQPMAFLAQIYAGLDRSSNGFHRMLYVFCCRQSVCYTENKQAVTVLRSQLAADNPFYGLQPVPEGDADINEIGENKSFALTHNGYCDICNVCGCKAPLKCGDCHSVHYCSKEHQKHEWPEHKKQCSKQDSSEPVKPGYLFKNSLLFKEFDIIIEKEKEKEKVTIDAEELENMKNSSETYGISLEDAESLSKEYGTDNDPTFTKFKERVGREPDQLLRYARHDEVPLWAVASSQCTSVPPCSVCSAPRTFEFQLLPTLLYILGLGKAESDMDWATIAVFTCSADCQVEEYTEEFAWTQSYS